MVVTEYRMPSAVPKGRPTCHVDRIGLRQPAGGIQDAICIENESHRHGERGKPIAEGAIYEGCKQSDPGENDHRSIKWRHRWLLQLPATVAHGACDGRLSLTAPGFGLSKLRLQHMRGRRQFRT